MVDIYQYQLVTPGFLNHQHINSTSLAFTKIDSCFFLWKLRLECVSRNIAIMCAMVKSRYIGDGHPTFFFGILIIGI